jgi:hypothetical protein
MIASPGKAQKTGRRPEVQTLVAVVPCASNRGLAGIKIDGLAQASSGEYFMPFTVGKDATPREYAYAGLTAAIERLRSLHVERTLIVMDDDELVAELERRVEPPHELFLNYIILGCRLNEFRRARVVSAKSSRLEELRAKTQSLAATIYNVPLLAPAM